MIFLEQIGPLNVEKNYAVIIFHLGPFLWRFLQDWFFGENQPTLQDQELCQIH